jgi:hypothetical protein
MSGFVSFSFLSSSWHSLVKRVHVSIQSRTIAIGSASEPGLSKVGSDGAVSVSVRGAADAVPARAAAEIARRERREIGVSCAMMVFSVARVEQ